jgi:hypothetical protein
VFALPEVVTVWKRTGNDGLGGLTWSDPVTWPARIAYSQQRFTDLNGDQVVSSAVCYTEAPITPRELRDGVRVLLGAVSGAVVPPAEADDIRAVSNTPSGAGALRKFWFA